MSKINFTERIAIAKLLSQRKSIREIGRCLGRSASSISSELRRQGMNRECYDPLVAEEHAKTRKAASHRDYKIHGLLREIIDFFLREKRFSPEQICGCLKKRYSNMIEIQTCPETIYRYIYRSAHKDIYIKALRRKRKRRKKYGEPKRQGSVKDYVSISERPKEVGTREIPGHWEADLIIGKEHQSAIGSLVERSSRFTIIVHLGTQKDSASVVKKFHEALRPLSDGMKKSLTYDQGSEMSRHKEFTSLSGLPVYFAHKGCPWERGTNENTNGLIRDFFPKGTDFLKISEEQLKGVESLLNQRPRKILSYATPGEAFKWLSASEDRKLGNFLAI